MRLHVGGLAFATTEQELEEYFAACGKVASVAIIKDKYSGRSKGFGFVEMEDEDKGQDAIDQLNGKEFGGRTLTVGQARPREERRSSGGRRQRSDDSFRRVY